MPHTERYPGLGGGFTPVPGIGKYTQYTSTN